MIEDVRERRDHLTNWLPPNIKKALYVHWETDDGFKRCRLTNKANKASPRSSKYTGGSATLMKTKVRLSKSFNRDAMMAVHINHFLKLKLKILFLFLFLIKNCIYQTF
ncbi:hypothetical protein Ahy_B10g101838 [Arachis hypogaea]|uniref:Uncharacterized protein n=1 Tax=Arachis hypogaea TaxID=3818 RepID=A0A444X0L0_ARAHY|nr:hypothetical protein Ahy_B10g101838 [Arachis hypogaea]